MIIPASRNLFKIVLRYEVNAYQVPEQPSADSLTDQLSSLNVGSFTSGTTPKESSVADVRRVGSVVPQSPLAKAKSRTQHGGRSKFYDNEAYLQLYLGQIPALCFGMHDGDGFFTPIDEIWLDLERCSAAKERVQPALCKLRRLLEQVQNSAMESGQGVKLSLVFQDGELLLMQRATYDSFLPPAMLKRFMAE
ncbi:uncharacterized protein PHACADRAFT_201615 [Phanerochaete carnosa HHB-10118-sp]|uniref:Uncharacterized protein n=1 Tax=Phanerochaete carnosa (strain HHB-10118-sp) TaxID=650164 RepID=K5WI62_PHACS|nr:uncharacterized protein PHACADRAFT_201615 [Phanerochaete carnosa HHB-10118-sp]EKM49912.1 hypothetical protein PHACADRAFT_201615 [Phanerochaete carnosa HHB-10118-sp]